MLLQLPRREASPNPISKATWKRYVESALALDEAERALSEMRREHEAFRREILAALAANAGIEGGGKIIATLIGCLMALVSAHDLWVA